MCVRVCVCVCVCVWAGVRAPLSGECVCGVCECESGESLLRDLRYIVEYHLHTQLAASDEHRLRQAVSLLRREAARNDFLRDSNQLTSARGEGLLSLIARWGHHDVVERVLSNADFLEHRYVTTHVPRAPPTPQPGARSLPCAVAHI